ncbi:hypothetical protein NM208_g27 [Fusarium decemcellulare]|uniref:Uncharacterized protein n=1 Tax=Fusarium decemcellulare TaxID=57161 RepID=A0ACC1T0Q6_9HYPO|nr:hypothetical protein NM208_g27 [Fusarium decemcellulare]
MSVVVIVPGSFAPAKHYNSYVQNLAQHGIEAVVVDTPSVGRREGLPPATMSDDVNEIVKVVEGLLDDGKDVVIITHSYGGIPGTQSLEKLSRKQRSATGKTGGVDKIIYLASVVLQPGTANLDLFGPNLPDFLTVNDDYMTLDPEGQAPMTFSDLPPAEGLRLAKEMPEHSTPSFKEKLTYAGYNDVDVHYIVCLQDKIIQPDHQRGMIELVKASTGKEVNVHELNSGHAPNFSQPDNLTGIVKKIIE